MKKMMSKGKGDELVHSSYYSSLRSACVCA
jgi:hypothetical protein